MGVKRKASSSTTTIKITKKAYNMIRRYAKKTPKKSGKGFLYETSLQIMDRIMLDKKEGYPRIIKPLHDEPVPTYPERFKPTKN